jgi:hypothetical protein
MEAVRGANFRLYLSLVLNTWMLTPILLSQVWYLGLEARGFTELKARDIAAM